MSLHFAYPSPGDGEQPHCPPPSPWCRHGTPLRAAGAVPESMHHLFLAGCRAIAPGPRRLSRIPCPYSITGPTPVTPAHPSIIADTPSATAGVMRHSERHPLSGTLPLASGAYSYSFGRRVPVSMSFSPLRGALRW